MKHLTKRAVSLLLACVLTLSLCLTALPQAKAAGTTVKLLPDQASPFNGGKFQGWGTSLCWWANRVGYDPTLTKLTADAFFSEEGLGLDIARYNVGGGDDPGHNHIKRSDSNMPGFWESFTLNGQDLTITYDTDLSKDRNQLTVAKAALEANPKLYFEAFSNSAPYFMTVSGCTGGNSDASVDNLRGDMYDDFAAYIAESVKLLRAHGINVQSYSPMNEPDTSYWQANSEKQEGCHFSPGTSQSQMIVATRNALDAAGLADVLVAGMDESSIDTSVANLDKLTPEAKNALGRIDTHTYGGSDREGLKNKALSLQKNLWMSEVDGDFKSGSGAMEGALGFAKHLIDDMNWMQPAAWVLWNAVDVHMDSTTGEEGWQWFNPTSGTWGLALADHDKKELLLSQKYYGFGQFTKYINPGDTIILTEDKSNVLAAYNKDSGDIKIVAVNDTAEDKPYTFDLSAMRKVGTTVTAIRTSGDFWGDGNSDSSEKWRDVSNESTLSLNGKTLNATLKANSITTFVIHGDAVPLSQGVYTLKMADGNFLTIGEVVDNAALITFAAEDTTTNKQKFRIVSDGEGFYTIQSVYNSTYLDVSNGGTVDGTEVIGYTATGGDNQKWYAVKNADGTYMLLSKNSDKALTVKDGKLTIETPAASQEQKLLLIPKDVTVYNTATLYDYSTAYRYGSSDDWFTEKHYEDLQSGKSDYNWDLAKQIGSATNNEWNGIFFSSGSNRDTLAVQLDKADLVDPQVSSSTHPNQIKTDASVTDGDLLNYPWDTWASNDSDKKRGSLTLSGFTPVDHVEQVKAYFYSTVKSTDCVEPTTATLKLTAGGNTYSVTVAPTYLNENLYVATFDNLGVLDQVTDLTMEVYSNTTDHRWMVISEIEVYTDNESQYLTRTLTSSDVDTITTSAVNASPSDNNTGVLSGMWLSSNTHSGEVGTANDLHNGNLTDKVWTTWDSDGSKMSSGTLTMNTNSFNGLQTVKLFFTDKDGTNPASHPTDVKLTVTASDGDHVFTNPFKYTFAQGDANICEVIFQGLNSLNGVTAMKIDVTTSPHYLVLSEVEVCTTVSDWNNWTEADATDVFNGNKTDRAWTSYSSKLNKDNESYISVHLKQQHWISEVNVYLSLNGESNSVWPTEIQLRNALEGVHPDEGNDCYTFCSGYTDVTINGQNLRKYTIHWDGTRRGDVPAVYTQDFELLFKQENFDTTRAKVIVTEVEVVTCDTYFSANSQWTGHSHDLDGNYVMPGLAKSTLTNGEISFNVPEAGLFTQDEGNKEVYNNIQIPFVYSSADGYYTFSTNDGTDHPGTDVHFPDKNGDGKLTRDEFEDGAILVRDDTRHDPPGDGNGPGFFPFNMGTGTQTTDYHFGMKTAIHFTMTPDGTVSGSDGTPITFEFAGDDDVWVYIDGKLVLDLGGVHDSMSAKIDFHGNSITTWGTYGNTNLTNAGKVFNDENGAGILNVTRDSFANGEEHDMMIFYLERGAGESNCLIRYNMPRTNVVQVGKEIESSKGSLSADELEAVNKVDFTFRITDAQSKPLTGLFYLYENGTYLREQSTDANGYFTLKNNQYARFIVPEIDESYMVVESRNSLNSSVWKTPTVQAVFNSQSLTNPAVNTNKDAFSTTLTGYTSTGVGDTLYATFTNIVDGELKYMAGETVVIDYGLPVLIDIMSNDYNVNTNQFTLASVPSSTYGKVEVVDADGKTVEDYASIPGSYYLKFTPTQYLSNVVELTYSYGELSGMSATATVIPATTMYYEENFKKDNGEDYITFTNSKMSGWTGFTAQNDQKTYSAYQEPGVVGTANDSPYGTDAAYLNGAGDSHGTSYYANTKDNGAAFTYTFTGTGTAFFARISEKSAYLRISIKDKDGKQYFNNITPDSPEGSPYVYIDTKYAVAGKTLYNIPVFNIEGMPYNTYKVTVTIAKPRADAWYAGQEDFYLDGVRVYNPMGLSEQDNSQYQTASNAYAVDMEAKPKMPNLRDYILSTQTTKTKCDIKGGIQLDAADRAALTDGNKESVAWQTTTEGSVQVVQVIDNLNTVTAYLSMAGSYRAPKVAKLQYYTGIGEKEERHTVYGAIKTEDGVCTVTFAPVMAEPVTRMGVYLFADTGVKMAVTELEVYTATWNSDSQNSIVFTDTNSIITAVNDYESIGPKEEVYLNLGQSLGFKLSDWTTQPTGTKLFLGMKTPEGGQCKLTINGVEYTLNNTTDCYYDITEAAQRQGGVIVIKVTQGLVSLTNMKSTGSGIEFAALMEPDADDAAYTVYDALRLAMGVEAAENPDPGEEENPGEEEKPGEEENPGEQPNPSESYSDLDADAWYCKGVDFVLLKGLMLGRGNGIFAPMDVITRGELITVLYRMTGEPDAEGECTFCDVKKTDFFYDAVLWAEQNGISNGAGMNRFLPTAPVTREQMVTFFYRYAKYSGADMTVAGDLNAFADADSVQSYAKMPMAWAIGTGLICGMENNTLQPGGLAVRAQAATILMRYCENVAKD